MFLFSYAFIQKLPFLVILVVPWLWSLYAFYCLENVENVKLSLTNNKDLTIFSVSHDLYKPLLESYTQVV